VAASSNTAPACVELINRNRNRETRAFVLLGCSGAGGCMQKSDVITAVLLTATVSVGACNDAYSDRDGADSRAAAAADEGAVATSGTLPTAAVADDAAVTSRIQAKFFLDPGIKMRRIDVDTQGGIVTLRGDVASDNERAQALILARTTEGVERVEDALAVNPAIDAAIQGTPAAASNPEPAPTHAQDEALTSAVQARFSEDESLKSTTIAVTAKDGVVLLDGTAQTAAARQRAISIARGTEGVVQVIDRIAVK
jgi:osmotically-inducible protein OsmY